ncbi:hypothetical protein AKJ09_00061 [Labilithrix luteola]|uniref:Uncharacterized protein n=1 Tax=Labilithrix luteola TaxID=1391654 RepID=A0A0K1PIQ4_9BACT|nr:hypothetical protein AKJ09_00061 [Labilithrix luteola]
MSRSAVTAGDVLALTFVFALMIIYWPPDPPPPPWRWG